MHLKAVAAAPSQSLILTLITMTQVTRTYYREYGFVYVWSNRKFVTFYRDSSQDLRHLMGLSCACVDVPGVKWDVISIYCTWRMIHDVFFRWWLHEWRYKSISWIMLCGRTRNNGRTVLGRPIRRRTATNYLRMDARKDLEAHQRVLLSFDLYANLLGWKMADNTHEFTPEDATFFIVVWLQHFKYCSLLSRFPRLGKALNYTTSKHCCLYFEITHVDARPCFSEELKQTADLIVYPCCTSTCATSQSIITHLYMVDIPVVATHVCPYRHW